MDITQLYISQRNLRRSAQIPALISAIRNGSPIPPIRLSEAEDGTIQVDDGHHRAVAYWLCGRTHLAPHEYDLTLTDKAASTLWPDCRPDRLVQAFDRAMPKISA